MGTGETQPRAAELAVGRRWTFGPAVLDERSLELTVNGELARIERKPLEVLLYLLHHAGEVVTKDELADNLWPGRILTETVLTRCISQLRQVLKDDDRSVIRTVHGYGYRLVAEVKVDATTTPGPPAFSFEPGQQPPLRPHWLLVERLGTGGHGEAWLAKQDKTRDQRVFKFALDAAGLAALKREITLYRLLNDTLGERAPAVRLLEWNLEEPPYFIETVYVEGRDLRAWADAHGGLAGMLLERRLDLVAQIAEALAAAHSVGVLHKDLKPGNVLVQDTSDGPKVRLCDFGSGGVLDGERLEKLGITRLGFTNTAGTTSATPLYVAPEVIAGQPSTVAADIYALGVLLYQLAVGDFRKALAPGWELDVSDELLRDDIAAAAAGDPARRLQDAAQLAERLRSIDARRQQRVVEVADRERAQRTRRVQEELRRTRVYALLLLATTAIALAGGVMAYRAQNHAVAATATAEAVSGFLTEDVLRLDSGLVRPSEASYEALLDRAAQEVDKRLKDQPEAAANIHWLLGRRFQEIGQFNIAAEQYKSAVALFTDLYGEASEANVMALDRLAWAYLELGRTAEALSTAKRMRALWGSQLPPTDLAMLMVRTRIARTFMTAGAYEFAEGEFRAVVTETANTVPSTRNVMPLFKQWMGIEPPPNVASQILRAYANMLLAGNVLEELGDEHQEAESRLRDSLAVFSRELGPEHELSTLANLFLGMTLAHKQNFGEAEERLTRSWTYFDKSLPPRHFAHGISRMAMGRLRTEQRRLSEAATFFGEAVGFCEQDSACPPSLRAEFLWDLGWALNDLERSQAAVTAFRSSLSLRGNLRPDDVITLRILVGLSEALRQAGRSEEAIEVLGAVSNKAVESLKPYQLAAAELRRAEGLLSLKNGDLARARTALKESLDIVTRRHGPDHWRAERARTELAQLSQQ